MEVLAIDVVLAGKWMSNVLGELVAVYEHAFLRKGAFGEFLQ